MSKQGESLETRAGEPATDPRPEGPDSALRAGAVDIGSNAIRFLAAEVAGTGPLSPLEARRSPVRLGHEVFLTGRLTERSMEAAVEALTGFARLAGELELDEIRTVATSAVREAVNGGELVDRVRERCGLDVEMISGAEEARLIHLAVRERVPLGNDRWMLADLGGGSVEVSLVEAWGTLWSESHTIGSVRLLEELSQAAAEPGRYARLLEEYVSVLRLPVSATRDIAGFIATGGNVESLARLAVPTEPDTVAHVPLDRLRAVIATLSRMSYRQRVDELGLREDRADVILPAAMVYERLAALSGSKTVIVPFVGLKEGLVLDLAGRGRSAVGDGDDRGEVPFEAALGVGRRYMFDEGHGVQVARLAASLFDQLELLHGMGRDERRLLVTAALLHDIGQFISFKRHHKHSLYLLTHSELPGISPREMLVIANLARYHRKRHPHLDHPEFAALAPADQERVRRLAAILRLADAMDREHMQRVRLVRARPEGDELVLMIEGEGDLLLEKWALKKKSGLFSEVYGRQVRIGN